MVKLVLVCTHLCCVRNCMRVQSVSSVCMCVQCVLFRLQSILVGWGWRAAELVCRERSVSLGPAGTKQAYQPAATPSSTPQGELHPVSDLFKSNWSQLRKTQIQRRIPLFWGRKGVILRHMES